MARIKRREPKVGEDVRVHMNLNNGMFSVKPMEGESKGLVAGYFEKVSLMFPEFRVQEGAWEKVVDEGVRDVCAYVVGEWAPDANIDAPSIVRYNPFRCKYFTVDEKPIKVASFFTGYISDDGPVTHVKQPVFLNKSNE